ALGEGGGGNEGQGRNKEGGHGVRVGVTSARVSTIQETRQAQSLWLSGNWDTGLGFGRKKRGDLDGARWINIGCFVLERDVCEGIRIVVPVWGRGRDENEEQDE
ncbi:hypothetical protein PoB_004073900, partial [Plakobranchus ocellatus]